MPRQPRQGRKKSARLSRTGVQSKCVRSGQPLPVDKRQPGHVNDGQVPLLRSPIVYALGGPNGAGKTTFAREFLPAEGIGEFLNANLPAAGLSPLQPATAAARAARLSSIDGGNRLPPERTLPARARSADALTRLCSAMPGARDSGMGDGRCGMCDGRCGIWDGASNMACHPERNESASAAEGPSGRRQPTATVTKRRRLGHGPLASGGRRFGFACLADSAFGCARGLAALRMTSQRGGHWWTTRSPIIKRDFNYPRLFHNG